MSYTIFTKVNIFTNKKGSGISVNEIKFAKYGIEFVIYHPSSYAKGKPIRVFLPYQNIDYIES
jgi:hypothetical protein